MDLALQGFVLPLSTRIAVMEGEAGRASEEYGEVRTRNWGRN
jgi:hypothetical protein